MTRHLPIAPSAHLLCQSLSPPVGAYSSSLHPCTCRPPSPIATSGRSAETCSDGSQTKLEARVQPPPLPPSFARRMTHLLTVQPGSSLWHLCHPRRTLYASPFALTFARSPRIVAFPCPAPSSALSPHKQARSADTHMRDHETGPSMPSAQHINLPSPWSLPIGTRAEGTFDAL